MPGAFDVVERLTTESPNVDVVVGDTVFVDVDGRVTRLLPAHRMSSLVIGHYGIFAAPNALFFRRSLLQEVGFREDSRILMDKWVLLDLLRKDARFRYTPTPLGAMRRHGGPAQRSAQ